MVVLILFGDAATRGCCFYPGKGSDVWVEHEVHQTLDPAGVMWQRVVVLRCHLLQFGQLPTHILYINQKSQINHRIHNQTTAAYIGDNSARTDLAITSTENENNLYKVIQKNVIEPKTNLQGQKNSEKRYRTQKTNFEALIFTNILRWTLLNIDNRVETR